MILLVKIPVPVPSVVFRFDVVGLAVVPQHTPRAITAAPPSVAMFPPLVADVAAIAETAVVVRVGSVDLVEKVISSL